MADFKSYERKEPKEIIEELWLWLAILEKTISWAVEMERGRYGWYGAAWLSMVRRGSVDSASACCKAGPSSSSILGSAPQGGFSH